MTRKLFSLLLLVAIPATAQTFDLSIGTSGPPACLVLGNTTYRIAPPGMRADTTVRIDSAALAPDIRIEISDSSDEADLVLVDDGAPQADCPAGSTVKHVRIDAEATAPDLTIGFARAAADADYRIFVRSHGIEPTAAAALFAASRSAAHKRAAHPSN